MTIPAPLLSCIHRARCNAPPLSLTLPLNAHGGRGPRVTGWRRSTHPAVFSWKMNSSMSCQLIGSGETLITSWMNAGVRFFASVGSNVTGLESARGVSIILEQKNKKKKKKQGIKWEENGNSRLSPDAPTDKKHVHKGDICTVSGSYSYPWTKPPPSLSVDYTACQRST